MVQKIRAVKLPGFCLHSAGGALDNSGGMRYSNLVRYGGLPHLVGLDPGPVG